MTQLSHMLEALLSTEILNPDIIEACFLMALYWSLGASLIEESRVRFDDFVKGIASLPAPSDENHLAVAGIVAIHFIIGIIRAREDILSRPHSLRYNIGISISNDALTLNKHIGKFNKYIIYMQEILMRIHKCAPTDRICTCCLMNKPYMKGVQKW